jgi:autotransporter-associated beta strand protein
MILYSGSFNPLQPGLNAITGNDDHSISIPGGIVLSACGSVSGQCPALSATLNSGTSYYLFLSHWGVTDAPNFTLPQTVWEDGPGTVTWSLFSASTDITTGSGNHLSDVGAALNSVFDGGVLTLDSAATSSSNFTITGNHGTIDQNSLRSTFSGVFSDASLSASGKLRIINSGSGGAVALSGVNTYSGGTEVDAGANLSIASGSALGSGTLALVGTSTTPATLTTTATTTIANAITVEGDPVFNVASGTTTTISGSITDGGSPGDVVVSGGGTLELTAVNTYTGPTTVDSGSTMALSGLGAIATSSAVSNNGTFNLTGKTNSVALSGSYTQASTGALAMSFASTNNQQLNIAGAANLNGSLSLSASSGSYRAGGRYALLTSSGLTGAFSSFTTDLSSYTRLGYALTYNANDVYLVFTPNVADTQASLGFSANALQGVFNLQSAAINNGLNYDCTVFEKHGICLSAGGRYTNVGGTPSNTTAGLVIGSYKLNKQIRIGGYLDQDISMNTSNGIKLGNNVPLMGLFGVWSQHNTGEGYEVRVAAGYGDKDLTVTRNVLGTSEAGMGTSLVKTHAASGVLSFGQRVSEQWIASPYAGIRYAIVSRNGYTEATSTDVTSPLTFNALNQESTTAMAGLRLTGKVHPKATIVASAGFESDLHHHVGNYSATGLAGLNAVAFNVNVNDTRPIASTGIFYDITKAQRVGASFVYRQEAFQSTDTKSVFVNYQVGF